MLNIGLVTDNQYSSYLPLIQESNDWNLRGVLNIDADSSLLVYEAEFTKILNRVDCVIFDTTKISDYRFVLEAVKCRKHVSLCNPGNYRKVQFQELVKIEHEAGVCVQLGHPYLYQSVFAGIGSSQNTIRLLKSDRLGESQEQMINSIKADITLALKLMGTRVRKSYVFCSATNKFAADIVDIRLDFEQGNSCQLHINTIEPVPMHQIKIYQYNKTTAIEENQGVYKPTFDLNSENSLMDRNKHLYAGEIELLRNFRNIILLNDSPIHTIDHELSVKVLMDKVKEKLKLYANPSTINTI